MRDKLIQLITEILQPKETVSVEEIADHLLANGVIVLPCELGKYVYDITEFVEKCPCPDVYRFCTDDIILSRCRKTKQVIFGIDGIDYTFDEFGKRVFTTEKEADLKISELLRSENGT